MRITREILRQRATVIILNANRETPLIKRGVEEILNVTGSILKNGFHIVCEFALFRNVFWEFVFIERVGGRGRGDVPRRYNIGPRHKSNFITWIFPPAVLSILSKIQVSLYCRIFYKRIYVSKTGKKTTYVLK
jgi:hypothetical protein